MMSAIKNDFRQPHVFTKEAIEATASEFVAVRAKVAKVSVDVMKGLAEKGKERGV
jgi:hypothetical protein